MQILLTNDDGIRSPGLWAAAEALSTIGYVTVVAPRSQSTGAGRSMPPNSDGIITPQTVTVRGKNWTVYAVGGTPAQVVQHGVLEVLGQKPDLLVAGINYGENLAFGVTVSGTVGAALEGASLGIPSIAVSLETPKQYHLSYSEEIDFSAAAHFTRFFAERIARVSLPEDVYVLKIDVPSTATPDTRWRVTRLGRKRYYRPVKPKRKNWNEPATIGYERAAPAESFSPDSDVYALLVERVVSVTPLSLDLTSRVDLKELERILKG